MTLWAQNYGRRILGLMTSLVTAKSKVSGWMMGKTFYFVRRNSREPANLFTSPKLPDRDKSCGIVFCHRQLLLKQEQQHRYSMFSEICTLLGAIPSLTRSILHTKPSRWTTPRAPH